MFCFYLLNAHCKNSKLSVNKQVKHTLFILTISKILHCAISTITVSSWNFSKSSTMVMKAIAVNGNCSIQVDVTVVETKT